MSVILSQYAKLLVQYCLYLKSNEKILIRSTPLAEPLLKALHPHILRAGAYPEYQLTFQNQHKLFYENAPDTTLATVSPFYELAIQHFDAILTIDAPYDRTELRHIDAAKQRIVRDAHAGIKTVFSNRSAEKKLKWSSCIYPTSALASDAEMSLTDFEQFVYNACFLMESNPIQCWELIGKTQEKIVEFLNYKRHFRFIGPHTDISFSTAGRLWKNSDGKRNMPSGEVFTAPCETSVNGKIYFSYPTIYNSQEVRDIFLEVKDGIITHWKAKKGQACLDQILTLPGANQFGEVAIGTNKHIKKATKNILFDEKMGGTIHMAVGAAYPETGGTNTSMIHWDMIKDMKEGQIIADDELIYENGRFKNNMFNL